jgi:hypothetical protein
MKTIDHQTLAQVIGAWGVSMQGQTPLPGGGNAQGGFTLGTDGIGFGAQGQTRLPWGGVARGSVQAGNFSLPKLPKRPTS